MSTSIPKHHEHHQQRKEREEDPANGKIQHFPVLAFVILGLIVLLRGLGQQGSVSFVPVLFEQERMGSCRLRHDHQFLLDSRPPYPGWFSAVWPTALTGAR